MTDKTGGKPLSLASAALAMARRDRVTEPLFCENARIVLSAAALTELLVAAEEAIEDTGYRMGYETIPVRRLRAAVEKVRGE